MRFGSCYELSCLTIGDVLLVPFYLFFLSYFPLSSHQCSLMNDSTRMGMDRWAGIEGLTRNAVLWA
jgi:hypothetical protein